jgi:hypothetical protein
MRSHRVKNKEVGYLQNQTTVIVDITICDRVKISRSDGYRPLKVSSVCDCIVEEDGESSRHDHP